MEQKIEKMRLQIEMLLDAASTKDIAILQDDDGHKYVYNQTSGKTTWVDGPATAEMATVAKHHHSRDSTQMPFGWTKHNDESGRRYYHNAEGDQSTSWEPPIGAVGGSAFKWD